MSDEKVASEEDVFCEGCGKPVDECDCRCPYCGETTLCRCCCGSDAVTGG